MSFDVKIGKIAKEGNRQQALGTSGEKSEIRSQKTGGKRADQLGEGGGRGAEEGTRHEALVREKKEGGRGRTGWGAELRSGRSGGRGRKEEVKDWDFVDIVGGPW